MASEEGPEPSSTNATAVAVNAGGDSRKGRSDNSVGHLLEPLNFSALAESPDRGGINGTAGSAKETGIVFRLSEQLAALAALLRPNQTNNEKVPNESPSPGNSLLHIQQAEPPLKYLTLAAGLLTCIWGWRAARSIERVVARRYADIAYQIRRPDALSARISAFKFLVLGGLVLPGSAVAFASLQANAAQPACRARESQEAHEALEAPLNASVPRRSVLTEMLPVTVQADMRRLVGAFHAGLSELVEAVAPSRQKWVQWAAGARTSHVAGLQRPSALSSRIATWESGVPND